jgi:hypothetical protein
VAVSKCIFLSVGDRFVSSLQEELIDLDVHEKDKLAHYARACTDVAFKFPFGRSELLGVAARGVRRPVPHASSTAPLPPRGALRPRQDAPRPSRAAAGRLRPARGVAGLRPERAR